MLFTCLFFAIVSTSIHAAPADKVHIVRAPDGGIFPQAQVDSKGTLHLTYFKGDPTAGNLFYVKSTNNGVTFSKPVQVNSQRGSVMVIGTVRGPQMALGKNGRVHVGWMGSNQAEPKADGKTPFLFTRSNDAGDRFDEQRNAIVQHIGLDGGGSIAADADGQVYIAWHAPDDQPGEVNRQVWIIKSKDEGKNFTTEKQANPEPTGACGCCGMKIHALQNGQVAITYRTATEKVHRDMHLLISKNAGESFKVAVSDEWNIPTCAMSTFSMASSNEKFAAAWETEQQIKVAYRATNIGDFSKPITVPGQRKNQKHPTVAIRPDGQFLVAWAEGTGWQKGGQLAWQVFNADGSATAIAGRSNDLPMWSVPMAVTLGNGDFCVIY